MIADLKPYSEYKESGLPWLGQVPKHWDIRRTKAILREINRRSTTGTEPLLSLRMLSGLVDHHAAGGKLIPPSALIGYKRVLPGEMVMNRMRAAAGLFAAATSDGLVSPDYAIFRPTCQMSLDYFVQLFRTPAMTSVFRFESRGLGTGESGFLRLYSDRFGMLPALFPPPSEQAAIVRFLDSANHRFDHLIRVKKKQLTLVGELRQSITEEALSSPGTKSVRLGVAAELIQRPIDRQKQQVYTPVGLYNRGRGIFHKEPTKGADLGDSQFFWIEEGDLVLSGQFAWEGAIALAGSHDSGCVASHRYPILRGRSHFVASAVLLAFFKTQFGALILDLHSRGAAGRNRPLNASTLLKEHIPIPALPAQRRIIELVDFEARLTNSVGRVIKAIHEYRSRLIADIVTGKLDVREVGEKLSRETAPDIPDNDTELEIDSETAEEEVAL